MMTKAYETETAHYISIYSGRLEILITLIHKKESIKRPTIKQNEALPPNNSSGISLFSVAKKSYWVVIMHFFLPL